KTPKSWAYTWPPDWTAGYSERHINPDAGASRARFPRWSVGTIGWGELRARLPLRAYPTPQHLIVPTLQRGNACRDALRPGLTATHTTSPTPYQPAASALIMPHGS